MSERRYNTDQLNLVIENWEKIASEFNGQFKFSSSIRDERGLAEQLISKKNASHLETIIHTVHVNIPVFGKLIQIATSDYRQPTFNCKIETVKFSFNIVPEDFFDKIFNLFSDLHEIKINVPDFDKNFILHSNNPEKLKQFLDNKIRDWLMNSTFATFDLHSENCMEGLYLFSVFNEFEIYKIKEQVEMFIYCISKLDEILKS